MAVMYKLLVVDDEPRQVKALVNIIKKLRPEYEVFMAEDGQEALKFISKNPVDILFTDIKMPNMDGLQFIEELSKSGIAVKTVILSGYGEFEYAQKAIRFGVNDYIVKPISKTDLEETLVKVENSLREEQDAESQKESLKKKLDNSLPVYIEHQLNKWITGNLNAKELDEITSIFPFKGPGTVIITSFSKHKHFSESMDSDFIQYAKSSMKEALSTIGHTTSFYLESEINLMVTVLIANNSFNLLSNDNIKRLHNYIRNLKYKYDVSVTIGVGENLENIFEGITESFRKAKIAIEHRFFIGLEKIIFYSDVEAFSNRKSINLFALETEISEAVRRADKALISRITSRIFGCINDKCNVNPYQFKEAFLHLLWNQAKIVKNLMLEERYNAFIASIKNKIIQCEEYKELWHHTNNTLFMITDILSNNLTDKNGLIINKCMKYINEHYMDNISLESVSQKYYFNPSYFSKLFKSYTGLGFSEYLLKVRVNKADFLLKNTDDNISEIARRIGFKDPSYFNRVFKKEVGISPLRYRQMNKK